MMKHLTICWTVCTLLGAVGGTIAVNGAPRPLAATVQPQSGLDFK